MYMSHLVRKPTICIGENKCADQFRGNHEADQRLCFRHTDSTISPLLKSKISNFYPASVTVQPDLCQTCSETTLLVFPRGGSYYNISISSGDYLPLSSLILGTISLGGREPQSPAQSTAPG